METSTARHIYICVLRYVLALLAGVALSFAYAPTDLGMIAWFFPAALLALLWSIPHHETNWKKNWGRGFRLAFVAGFGFWFRDVSFVGVVSQNAGWASSGGLALYLSLYFGLYGGWATTLGRWRLERSQLTTKPSRNPALQILGLAALHGGLWCGLEWLRGLSRLSFGWDGLGVSFIESGIELAQAADLIGVTGLSFIPVFGGAVLIQTLRTFHLEAFYGYRRAHWEVGITLSLLCLMFFYGTNRLQTLNKVETLDLRSLIVQQNIPVANCWDDGNFSLFSDAMESAFLKIEDRAMLSLEQTGRAQIETPDIVLFPESALPYPLYMNREGQPHEGQPIQHYINEEVRKHGDFLLITGVVEYPSYIDEDGYFQIVMEKGGGNFYNSVAFFEGDFTSYEMKAKSHLMPFGEYMPFSWVPFVSAAFEYSAGMTFGGSFTPAQSFSPQPAEIDGEHYSIIPSVCYEDSVSRTVRHYIRPEPQVIVNVTNDGWFAGSPCAEKHFQNARFRAIEYRRPLLRAANTGLSGAVNINGSTAHPITGKPQELRASDGNYEIAGSLETLVQTPKTPIFTLYSMIGDLFSWGGGLIAVLWSLFQIFKVSLAQKNEAGKSSV